MSDLSRICPDIRSLVLSRLEDILGRRRERILKPDGSYVTPSDLLVQEIVASYLTKEHPACRLISEELDLSGFRQEPEATYVVLDPLDGTENFTSGLVEWGVGLSVFSAGYHRASMILLPELNRSLMTGDRVECYTSRIHGISSSLSHAGLASIDPGFEYRMMGCAMYNMYNVIHGSFAIFQSVRPANAWDILPGLNLALEHGCAVEVDGRPYEGGFLPPTSRYAIRVVRENGR